MNLKKGNKKKTLAFSIALIQILLILSLFNNDVNAFQDDNDLECTIHGSLYSDSAEIDSNYLTTGFYDFFETPALDIGTFDHDFTKIDVNQLHEAHTYQTSVSSGEITSYSDNDTIITSKINEYEISMESDTIIDIQINYTFKEGEPLMFINLEKVAEYTIYETSELESIHGIETNGTHYVILRGGTGEDFFIYDLNWDYLGLTYDCHPTSDSPTDLYWNGTHWIQVNANAPEVMYYDEEWNYIGNLMDDSNYYLGIGGNETHYILTDNLPTSVHSYDKDWNYVHHITSVDEQSGTQMDVFFNEEDGLWYVLAGTTIFVYDNCWTYLNRSYALVDTARTFFFHDDSLYVNKETGMGNGYRDKIYQYDVNYNIFDNITVQNFAYQMLGIDYIENITLTLDESRSSFDNRSQLSAMYTFNSSQFTYYDHENDLVIPTQNLTLFVDYGDPNVKYNYTTQVTYTAVDWKVPTEVNMKINGESVTDSTYQSGYVYLSEFPENLTITASTTIYFKLNITSQFAFSFDLEIISKTYLRKDFELISNHEFEIDRLVFSSNLEIKKIYLNREDLGSSNPNYLNPSYEMNEGNIYTIAVILSEEIYEPLHYVNDDTFAAVYSQNFGTYTGAMSNSFHPSNYNSSLSVNGNVDIYNEFPNEFHYEDWSSWTLDYDNFYSNSSFASGNLDSYLAQYNNSFTPTQPADFQEIYGKSDYSGDLTEIDGSYTTFNSTKAGYFNATYDFNEDTEEGYYYGTYDFNQSMQEGYYYGLPDNFNDEVIGTSGTDIAFVDGDDVGVTEIIAEYQGHKNVLQMTADNGAWRLFLHSFPNGVENSGVREFWMASSNASNDCIVEFRDSGTGIIKMKIDQDKFQYMDSLGSFQDVGLVALDATWYHVKVQWYSDNTWDLYIDGTKYLNGVATWQNMNDGIDDLRPGTISGLGTYYIYMDAWGDPADSNYESGYDLNPYDIENLLLNTFDYLYTAHNSWVNISDIVDGHNEVLTLYDGSGSKDDSKDEVGGAINFDAQTTGTIEFWVRSNDMSDQLTIELYDSLNGAGNPTVILGFFSDKVKYYYSGGWHDATGGAISDDTWYHVRIVFDCSSDTYDAYLDGNLLDAAVPFGAVTTSVKSLKITTLYTTSDYHYYLDGLGFSWDTESHYGLGYELGYNLNPYNIENLLLNAFDYLYAAHDSHVNVTTGMDGHYNVLELYDNAGVKDDSKDEVGGAINFDAQTTGTIEFWVRSNDVSDQLSIELYDSLNGAGNPTVILGFFSDKVKYYYSGGWHDATGGAISDDTWYHVRIVFDCSSDTYDAYLDGNLLDAAVPFGAVTTSVKSLKITTLYTTSDYHYYLDGLGFSWDSNYDVGDNENSCKIEFNVDVDLSQIYNLNASSEDAVDFTHLYYSHKTDIFQLFNLSMYNVKTTQYDVVNSSYNNESFYDNLEDFNFNDYINGSGHLILKFVGFNFSTEYQLYLEKIVIEYNWTKQGPSTFASISKDIDYSLLNYYDPYGAYQKLYNISINFQYRFTNHTSYNENASFSAESMEISLTTDGIWNELSHDFTFDSASENDFTLLFNISNGLLELADLNYSIIFICLDFDSKTRLYQSFELDPSFTLTEYQRDDFEIILNFTHSLTVPSDYEAFDYHSSALTFNISVKSEEGWSNITFRYNSSASRNFELNIRDYLDNNSLEQFLDFKLYLWCSGNGTEFTMDDLYLYSMYERIQLTEAPRTDETSVEFVDYLVADRDFEYWYFYNNLEINDVDMTNIRTDSYTSEFDEENDRYYFEDEAEDEDVYESYLDYNPNYDVEYEIESDGATADLRIEYSADIAVKNCTIVLDLSDEEIYMKNWTKGVTQSSRTFILEIPRVNFTTSTKVLRLEGVSDFPSAHFSSFVSQELVMIDGSEHAYTYYGYIEYPRYSQAFYLKGIEDDWVLDGVHYGTKTMTIKQNNGYFECPGYDSSITTSYLKFEADPIDKFTVYDLEAESKLRIEIKCNLPVANASIMFALPSELRYEIRTTLNSLTKIPDVLGYDYYLFFYDGLKAGINNIYVEYRIHTIEDDTMLYFMIVILSIGFVVLYYYRKKKLERMETRGMTPEEKKRHLEKKKQQESYLSEIWKSLKKQVKNLMPENKYIKRARKIKKPKVLH